MAGTYGAEKTDCDSPFALVDETMAWIKENIKDTIDFVIWTGDSARHDSDEDHPRNDKQVLAANRAVADKIADTFSTPKGKLTIPVIPTFGNNDFLPHNIMEPGPNKWFHAYSDIWKRFIPEEQRHSFEFGGWFYVEVVPNKLAVFSLNTMFFFDRNAAVDGCARPSEPGYHHMEWLRVQLQRMRELGMKAILMGHVPPAKTDSKQNWDETCWQRYTLWLKQYRDVVTASLYGHMNIDHFLLADTKEISIDSNTEAAATGSDKVRSSTSDGEVAIQSKQDYLQELRDLWSDLPGAAARVSDVDGDNEESIESGKKKKGKKYKKIGGKYAERYQLSLVSPSIVPNYFPTIRVFEYNITGLEDSPPWEAAQSAERGRDPLDAETETSLELRSDSMEASKKKKKGKKDKKGNKGKKEKGKPKDPNLTIPDGPSKKSLPGPAYYPQQFTLLGYTQYFANLTYLNNDVPGDDPDKDAKGSKWRGGNPDKKQPKHKPPQPHDFAFEVEYSTFDDERFKLKDLTVRNYLKLAYRIGKHAKSKSVSVGEDDDFIDEDGFVHVDRKGGKKNKKKKGQNKTWLRFLDYAFVRTVPPDELEKM